jgi:signal transduction histidine kinase
MPHTLIHYGLQAALSEMAKRLNAMDKCTFSVTAFAFPERLTELAEISLYRVAQEWTNNIVKYSDAKSVEIQLTGHEQELIILVEDNGTGFDPQTLTNGAGNGWKNILSRLNIIKGTVMVDSTPTRIGTTLTLAIPRFGIERVTTLIADSASKLN